MERANRDVTERNNDLKGAGLQNRDKLTLLTGPGTGIAPNSKPLSRKTTLARANTTATDRAHSSVSLRKPRTQEIKLATTALPVIRVDQRSSSGF